MAFVSFQFMDGRMTFISQFNIDEVRHYGQMCYVNSNLVMSGVALDTIRVYHEETSNLLNEWKSCHVIPCLMVFEMEGKEYLLEGCKLCKVIRGYESPEISSNYKTLYEDAVPSVMCQGPMSTVLVLEEINSIKQLLFSEGRFNLVNEFPNELENIRIMCYCEKNEIVVALHKNQKTLTGIALATGEVVWKHTEIQFGSPTKVSDYCYGVFIISNERICIFNLRELFVLDPKDGTIKTKIFSFEGSGWIWNIATRNNGLQQIFAFQHGSSEQTEISLCKILPEQWLPLQNIISDDERIRLNTRI